MIQLPQAFAKEYCQGTINVPKMLTGSGQTPDSESLYQAFQTKRPWESVSAFLKAESNSCVKAAIRKSRWTCLVHQAMGHPLIVVCDVTPADRKDPQFLVWQYQTEDMILEVDDSEDPCGIDQAEEWAVRVDTHRQRRFVTAFAEENKEHLLIKQAGSESQEMIISASIDTMNAMIVSHQANFHQELAPISYCILRDFMGDVRCRTQATVVATFKGGEHRNTHLGNIRKLAAKLCSLGGSTLISDGVLRFQASDDAHLDQLVEEALNFGQQGMLYPPRQDLKRARIVTPAALNSELESDEKLYLLTSPSLLQEKQWRRAAESMQLSPVGTVAQAHSVLVKGPASAQVRRKEFKWATIYMRNHEDVLKEVGTEGEPLAAKASLATSISPATSSSSSSPSSSSSFPTPSSSPFVSSFTSTSPIITHPTPGQTQQNGRGFGPKNGTRIAGRGGGQSAAHLPSLASGTGTE